MTHQTQKKHRPLFPLATALRVALAHYNRQTLRHDFMAGLVVALIALPLAMALSIAVGLPPQHGLYTAIVAGAVAAIFGGSMTQVSGPTAAFVVIIAPIVADFGLHGLIWCQIFAGILLIIMGTARLGKIISYVPYPVITGFTAGIAVTIATLALNDFLGLGLGNLGGHYAEKVVTIAGALKNTRWAEALIGITTLMAIFIFPRLAPRVPAPVAGVVIGTALAWILSQNGITVDTLLSRFSYTSADGAVRAGIPPYPPVFHLPGGADTLFKIPDFAEFRTLLVPSILIAALAGLESLLSAAVADSMVQTKHDPNAELNGIGIANILSGLVAGIPATGAIARTAANIHAGGRTPVSALFHSLILLVIVVTCARWISHIPMSALSALLISVAWRMSHARECLAIIRQAPRSDVVVLLTCFILTVFIDMVAGVAVGMIMACLSFMKRMADHTHFRLQTADGDDDIAHEMQAGTMIYRIDGPLFFGNVAKITESAGAIPADIRTLILDLERMSVIDISGIISLRSFVARTLDTTARDIVLCGKPAIADSLFTGLGAEKRARIRLFASFADYLKNK